MVKISQRIGSLIQKIIDKFNGNGLMQDSVQMLNGDYQNSTLHQAIRKAGGESIVLLKNNGVLPLKNMCRVAVFGRCQFDWFYVGYGSGGDVKAPHKVSFDQALGRAQEEGYLLVDELVHDEYAQWRELPENKAFDGWWGHWPMCYDEMPLDENLVAKSSTQSQVAIVVIGRAAGEDRENVLKQGSYYLTEAEEDMLDKVTKYFENIVVVVNAGNIVDMSWTDKYDKKIGAILYAWQCGMESGNSLVDILTGDVNPSAKLVDTIAKEYADYPSARNFGNRDYNNYAEDIFVGYRYFETFAKEKVRYPFGFGLSYTTFDISITKFEHKDGELKVTVKVLNTGACKGKEVVQMYVSAPQGLLGKASRVLVAFGKTDELESGQSQEMQLSCKDYDFASYDDTGSVYKYAYVLEKGEYKVFVGDSVRTDNLAGSFVLEDNVVLDKLTPICKVNDTFSRMAAKQGEDRIVLTTQSVPVSDYSLRERILEDMPKLLLSNGKQVNFDDVLQGRATLDEFVATLDNDELQALTRGYGGMNYPQGVAGNAGAYGGIIQSLQDKGVRAIITTDGPAGIRIAYKTSLLPCGTALACSWNTKLVYELYSLVAEEMHYYNTDVLLGAGMNIHRNPLCGRNFEYFSEDPLISGKFAVAFVKGLQDNGRVACPKHFACNNQETRRNRNDSRLSERALREIYLKGFEICVKESKPVNIMTSYNKVNGVWCHYNYDLATVVLRKEWGFDGTVITDWWMRESHSPEFPKVKNNAYRIRSQVDVLMPGGKSFAVKNYKPDTQLLRSIDKKDNITKAEMQRSAKNTLKTLLWLENYKK